MSDDNIVHLDCITSLDIPAERVARALLDRDLESLVAIGFTDDGEFYFASNIADAGTVIYFLEMAKKKLLQICDEENITR